MSQLLATVTAEGLSLDPLEVARTAAVFAGCAVIVGFAKWLRDLIAARRSIRLASLIVDRDNTPVAIEMAGFVLAMTLGLLGALEVGRGQWWEQALDLLGTGAIVMLVLLLNDQVISRLVLRGLDCNRAVASDHNLAVAIVRAGGNVATALALQASLGHESPLWARLIWVVIGQLALVLLSLLYQRLTPYDDVAEVRQKNVAAALPMAGILLAAGIVVNAALAGEGGGWGADLLSVGLDLAVSALLIFGLRWAGDRFLLPGSTFADEIARDKNAGAGFVEATIYISAALFAATFLN